MLELAFCFSAADWGNALVSSATLALVSVFERSLSAARERMAMSQGASV
jgi:hypothetical protein